MKLGIRTSCRCAIRYVVAMSITILSVAFSSTANAQERIEVSSPEELLSFFEGLDYTPEAWEAGIREVPRAYVMSVGDRWRVNSKNIVVINKKRIFFRALGPLALRANELIEADRSRLLDLAALGQRTVDDTAWLGELAVRYKVVNSPDSEIGSAEIAELIKRVDVVPPSLALAQGAEESGWGTSRFAAEGNALFGQWAWGGKGIKPKEQRAGLGDYQIAAFDTPLGSIQAYMRNINTHSAYEELRQRRANMREADERISGWTLAETLTSYSERGAEYVKSLHTIMRVNKLQGADEAVLVDGPDWHIYPTGELNRLNRREQGLPDSYRIR